MVKLQPGGSRPSWQGPPPLAVVVDLDDTLFPQEAYLAGAAASVAAAAVQLGLDGSAVHAALRAQLAAGSDAGGTIDRALLVSGVPRDRLPVLVPPLVAAFTGHQPEWLPCFDGVPAALERLLAVVPVVCLTDGNPAIQRAKLAATGLDRLLPAVVITDELGGRALRKPHPAGLLAAAAGRDVEPDRIVVIGDRPAKDVAVAAAVGARSVRVRQGEHAGQPDDPPAWAVVPSFPAAVDIVLAAIEAVRSGPVAGAR